jgi:myo-inositol 2-dehydrogenase/D-chiro-inositol 1-dehydrogenase
MGAEHARLLDREVSGVQLQAIFDIDSAQGAAVASQRRGARTFEDPLALIRAADIDAVLVASSDGSHEELVLAAIAAGKPVLCEKPLAPDIEGCQRILKAELELGRRLVTVGFMRRFDSGYRDLKSGLDGGGYGAALLVHCIHRNRSAAAGAPTETLITGSAVHEFDILRWLLDEEPARITVLKPRSSRRSLPTEDPLLLLVETTSGVIADIEVFVNTGCGYEVRCEVVAEQGSLSLDAPSPIVVRRDGGVVKELPSDWRPRFVDAYRRELQSWVDSLAAEPSADLASSWDGYAATVAAQAGVRALRAGTSQEIALGTRPALYAGATPADKEQP